MEPRPSWRGFSLPFIASFPQKVENQGYLTSLCIYVERNKYLWRVILNKKLNGKQLFLQWVERADRTSVPHEKSLFVDEYRFGRYRYYRHGR